MTNKRDPNIDIPGPDEFSNFDRLFQKVIAVPRAAIKEDPKKPAKKKPGEK